MTDAITFDTHRFVKNLTASGFTEKQAEALAHEQVHLLNSNLATKTGLAAVQSKLRSELKAVENRLRAELQEMQSKLRAELKEVEKNLQVQLQTVRADLLKWMITAMIAQTGLIVALVRLL